MLRVGLTGGIGSGKSSVAQLLRDLGAIVTDADQVARAVVDPGTPALARIRQTFGDDVIQPDGTLDRAGLAALVFPDPPALERLEAITGPAIAAEVTTRRAAVPADRVDVYDMPLLIEKGLWVHEQLTVVVGASETTRMRRLIEQRGVDEQDARARMARQASDEQRRAAADAWIDNDGSREATREQVDALWRERLAPYEANLQAGRRSRRPETLALTEPDSEWAGRGARTCARLKAALGIDDVQHIGSTAIPRLVAKDVIDVQVGVASFAQADDPAFEAALNRAGYLRSPDNRSDRPKPGRPDPRDWEKRYYGGQDPAQVVHVHVRRQGGAGYQLALALRDCLRADPRLRQEYAALKRRLQQQGLSTSDYAQAKEPWFDDVYPRVVRWQEEHA